MSGRPAPDRDAEGGRRSRRGGETGEAGHAAPLNLGCGTLVVLFLLVATAGKFLPHRAPERSPGVKPVASPPVARDASPAVGQAHGLKARASKSVEKPVVPAKKEAVTTSPPVSRPGAGPSADGLAELTSRLQSWANATLGRLPELVPGSMKDAPASAAPSRGEPVAPPGRQGGAVPPVAAPAGGKIAHGPSLGSRPPSPPGNPVRGARVEPAVGSRPQAEPAPGRAVVFNSPWDKSVEQVLRYLKRHTHDAESIEVLEWGAVRPTGQGYEVRCSYRSRNVLGRLATQNQLFVLDRDGQVTDIRD